MLPEAGLARKPDIQEAEGKSGRHHNNALTPVGTYQTFQTYQLFQTIQTYQTFQYFAKLSSPMRRRVQKN